MKFFIKNNLISIGEGSSVLDERGNEAFVVRGKAASPTRKKFLYDKQGNLLYTVRNKYWRLFKRSAYVYDGDGNKIARLKERFFRGYDVLIASGMEVEGKFLEGLYVKRNGRKIGRFGLQNSLATFIRDAYELDVYSAGDEALLVAFVVAYDNIRDQRKDK